MYMSKLNLCLGIFHLRKLIVCMGEREREISRSSVFFKYLFFETRSLAEPEALVQVAGQAASPRDLPVSTSLVLRSQVRLSCPMHCHALSFYVGSEGIELACTRIANNFLTELPPQPQENGT